MNTDIESMIRVNQAGEYGATRIYAGQLAIMNARSPAAREIARMAAQEERHRQTFDKMMAQRRVRPTLLAPFWNIAGYGLGMATALIGPEAAMACTVAVETEIDRHYGEQLVELGDSDPELSAAAERAPAFPVMSAAIRLGCRAAIALSKRI
jgi:3-demethoxyubiquinol 3-hydroxylase